MRPVIFIRCRHRGTKAAMVAVCRQCGGSLSETTEGVLRRFIEAHYPEVAAEMHANDTSEPLGGHSTTC